MKEITFLEELEMRLNLLDEEINSVNKETYTKAHAEPEIKELLVRINSEINSINDINFSDDIPDSGLSGPVHRYLDY